MGSGSTATRSLVVFAVLVVLTFALQWKSGAYEGEFGGHPDEAAHVVTGLMIRDYIAAGFPGHPMRYAQNYYDHYPRVALGHYPPGFYLMYAPWMLVFGPARASTLTFLALVLTCLSFSVFLLIRRRFSSPWALGCAVLFSLVPLVQRQTSLAMSDTTLALFCLWAALLFVKYVEEPRLVQALGFGVLAAGAVMIKSSGLMVALLVPFGIVFSGRFDLLKRWTLYLSALPMLLICLPWLVFTYRTSSEGMPYDWGIAYTAQAVPWFFERLGENLGVAIVLPATVGLFDLVVSSVRGRKPIEPFWSVVVALVLSVLVFYSIVPIGMDPRYVIPAIPSVVLLAIRGVTSVAGGLVRHSCTYQKKIAVVLAMSLVALFLIRTLKTPGSEFRGFRPLVEMLLSEAPMSSDEILVSSDAKGEGAVIAEIAMRDKERPYYVVRRSSKVLAQSDWMGRGYRVEFQSETKLLEYLAQSRISWVIVDSSIPERKISPHHTLLRSTMESYPSVYKKVGSFAIHRAPRTTSGEATLYRRVLESM